MKSKKSKVKKVRMDNFFKISPKCVGEVYAPVSDEKGMDAIRAVEEYYYR